MEATIINFGCVILIIILYPFAMEIYKESKRVKNEYYNLLNKTNKHGNRK
jgi:hypothetical protein